MFEYERMIHLNDLEMSMYNYIINHGEHVADMTIRELAKQLNVSTTTILRFCNKLDCEGYAEFKYRLKEFLKQRHNCLSDDFSVIENFFEYVKTSNLNAQIKQAADIICEKERVFFIGMGTSGTMGKYGARYMSNMGKYAMYIDDPFYPTNNNTYDDTVVIALSVSGEQQYLFREIQGLKKGHAIIISITNSRQCTLAEMSDLNLNYYIPMIILPGQYNVTSSLPVVYIIEKMAHYVHDILASKTIANREE